MSDDSPSGGPWSLIGDHKREILVVISGPSGAGKSSLIDAFLAQNVEFVRSISATTRAPRGAERDGVDYHFLDEATFQRWIEEGAFLEYAQVFGTHSYGTPRAFVLDQFAHGRSVIMDIDVQGARQIRDTLPSETVTVFVAPPTRGELERRLRGRGTDDDEAVDRRLEEAEGEVSCWREYDYIIINDDLESAVRKLQGIVMAERIRSPGDAH